MKQVQKGMDLIDIRRAMMKGKKFRIRHNRGYEVDLTLERVDIMLAKMDKP